MFFSNAGDRGRGMRVPHGTDRIPGGCLRATARSGNYQPRGNRRDRPIGPFLPCRQGARTKEGDIRANSNAGAGVGLILTRVIVGQGLQEVSGTGAATARRGFRTGWGGGKAGPPGCQSQGWSWRSCFAAGAPASSRALWGIPSRPTAGMAVGVSRRPATTPLRHA